MDLDLKAMLARFANQKGIGLSKSKKRSKGSSRYIPNALAQAKRKKSLGIVIKEPTP